MPTHLIMNFVVRHRAEVRNSLNEACNKLTLCTYPPTLCNVALKADNYSEMIVKFPAFAGTQHSLPRTYTPRNFNLFTATTNSFQTSNSILLTPTAILFHIPVGSAKWLHSLELTDKIS